MMKSTHPRVRSILALFLLLILLIGPSGCRKQEAEITGEPDYVYDVHLIHDTVYWIERSDNTFKLFCEDTDGAFHVRSFPGANRIVFCEEKACYYLTDDHGLASYSPVSDQISIICGSVEGTLLCAAGDYCLVFTDTEILRVHTESGEVLKAENMPHGFYEIHDMFDDSIVFWDHHHNTLCLYDCENDSLTTLYTREQPAGSVMVTAFLSENFLYFSESEGGFRKIPLDAPYESPEIVFPKAVIAAARTDRGMVLAAKDNQDIRFYILSENDEITEFAVWENARYILAGSCRLCVSEDKLACAVTTEQAIFTTDLPSIH